MKEVSKKQEETNNEPTTIEDSELPTPAAPVESTGAQTSQSQAAMKLIKLAAPMAGSQLLGSSPRMIAVIFIGQRASGEVLAAFGVAATFLGIVGISVGLGLTSALNTLASQAFGRDPKSPEIGILLQRALFVCYSIVLPLSILITLFSRRITAYVFSEALANEAALYLENSAPLLLLTTLRFCLSGIGACCGQPSVSLKATGATAAISLVTSYLFAWDLRSLILALTLNVIVGNSVAIYLIFFCKSNSSYVAAFEGLRAVKWWPLSEIPRKEVFGWKSYKQYLSLAGPALLAGLASWWASEATTVIAALVSQEAAAVQTVMLTISTVFFFTYVSLSRAVSVTIGISGSTGTAIIVLLSGDYLFKIFSSDPKIQAYAKPLTPWIAGFLFLDGLSFMLQGVFQGAGKQAQLASRTLFSSWVIRIPATFYLAIRFKLGILGVAIGPVVGLAVESPLYLATIRDWDWQQLASEASKSQLVSDDADGSVSVSEKEEKLSTASVASQEQENSQE